MDYEPEGQQEALIEAAQQEKTANNTHKLLVACKLAYIFAHGALVLCGSAAIGLQSGVSWYAIFLPVWLGDVFCIALVIYSWFASCPYIKHCLAQKQARVGDTNPSILTELLPEIVMAILGFLYIIFAFVGQFLLCQYLEQGSEGYSAQLAPSAVVFVLMAVCLGCRGICIRLDGEFFVLSGAGMLCMVIIALALPEGLYGSGNWFLVLPALLCCLSFIAVASRSLRLCRRELAHAAADLQASSSDSHGLVASCTESVVEQLRKERRLRVLELVVASLLLVALALLTTVLFNAPADKHLCSSASSECVQATSLGAALGLGICILSVLRLRLEAVRLRGLEARDRLVSWRLEQGQARSNGHRLQGV
eukprot:TRINITY_DN35677_c0_g1_i3.p1 TRINITY_DN35677_c0_g1~~TRINITY_DN35677_c0_g1_i3.p1  ORF type:complete len:365 (-),score=60.50 TRINITY_DN35677_c0_g1_i3:137-1231(-)